jgi:hypothetical protein
LGPFLSAFDYCYQPTGGLEGEDDGWPLNAGGLAKLF